MKTIPLITLLFSLGVYAQGSGYSPNDGTSPPGTFTSKGGLGSSAIPDSNVGTEAQGPSTMGRPEANSSGMTQNRSNVSGPGTSSVSGESNTAESTTSETGVQNSSGIGTQEVNPSVNPAPTSDKEILESTTLKTDKVFQTGPYREGTFDPSAPEATIEAQEEDAMDYSTTPKKDQEDKSE
jgi:hypothetical protein